MASSCAAASRRTCERSASSVEVAINEAHLCCGSAGTYSVLHPELAMPLRDRKLGHLAAIEPEDDRLGQHRLHPAPAERHATPVRHWVEVVDDALAAC